MSIVEIIEETDVTRDSSYEDEAVKNKTGNKLRLVSGEKKRSKC